MTISATLPSLRLKLLTATCTLGMLVTPLSAHAQAGKPEPKLIKSGDVLSGALRMIKTRGGKGKRVSMFQLESEPRRLAGPDGLCNLETGPETFQIVTHDDSDVSRLKRYVGKTISIKVNDISCTTAAGQVSEATVSKWSIVTQ